MRYNNEAHCLDSVSDCRSALSAIVQKWGKNSLLKPQGALGGAMKIETSLFPWEGTAAPNLAFLFNALHISYYVCYTSLTGCIKNLVTTVGKSFKIHFIKHLLVSDPDNKTSKNIDPGTFCSLRPTFKTVRWNKLHCSQLVTDKVLLLRKPSRNYGFLDDSKTRQYYLQSLFQKHQGINIIFSQYWI